MTSSNALRRPGRAALCVAVLAGAFALVSCGGGGGGSSSLSSGGGGQSIAQQIAACEVTNAVPALPAPSAQNSIPLMVDAGPCVYGKISKTATTDTVFLLNSVNIPYTSVKICVPNTTTCQTIDHVMVDSGSYGLRIMSSVLSGNLALPSVTNGTDTLVECLQFADGYSWGSVHRADVILSGETAASLPVQVIGDSSTITPPASCSGSNLAALNDPASFGANAVLGVGLFAQDCGSFCATGIPSTPLYYACPGGACTPVTVPTANQVSNPVASFTTNNNGVIIELPAVSGAGGGTLNMVGQMIFGIGTSSNNLTSVLVPTSGVYTADFSADFDSTLKSSTGYTVTTTAYSNSFIDSGSNGIYLPGTTIPTDSGGWFAPTAPGTIITLTATVQGHDPKTSLASGSISPTFSFDIANASMVLFPTNKTAFDGLGAPNTSTLTTGGIDWGLPFFLGKNVYIGLEPTPVAPGPVTFPSGAFTGPFWAW